LYRILALWSALVLSPPSYQALAIFIRFWLLPIEVGRHGLATGCYLLERDSIQVQRSMACFCTSCCYALILC
jgi:hypothetical protein